MSVQKTVVVLSCLFAVVIAKAQVTKTAKAKTAMASKFKQPKLKTALGSNSDTAASVTVNEALQLINLPLTITDDKKNTLTITSYQCLYKRKAVTEDEQSGKVSPTSSIVAQLFKTTPLPELWKKIITEQLKPGEELYFFDVVAKDAQGHLMFAPNLKLRIN
jgi:hypothetical protein